MEKISTRDNLQIDNVQEFANAVGGNDNLWQCLVGREVTHCTWGKGEVSLINTHRIFLKNFGGFTSYPKNRFIEESLK